MYPLTHTASTLNTREKSLLAQKWLSLRPQFSPAGYYRCSPMRSIGSCKQHSSIAYSQGELFGEVAACAKCTGWVGKSSGEGPVAGGSETSACRVECRSFDTSTD